MKIEPTHTTETIQTELGRRLAQRRVEMNLTQSALAEQAGIGKRTLESVEAGKDCQFSTLLRILSVLNLTPYLNQLVPEMISLPIEFVKSKSKRRRRASTPKTPKVKKPWKWGNEK